MSDTYNLAANTIQVENVTQYADVSGIVRSYNYKTKPARFNVFCPNMNRSFHATCSFFCPLRNDDVLVGRFRIIDETNIELVTPPFVQPPCDRTSLTNFFIKVTRKGFVPCRAIYNIIAKLAENEDQVAAYLTGMAEALKSNAVPKEEVLTLVPIEHHETLTKILTAWYRDYGLRRLYLLGLTKKDIFDCEPLSCEAIYNRCLANPYTLPAIDLEKCARINQILRKTTEPLDIYRGRIVRHIYDKMQNGWVGVPHHLMIKAFSDISKHMEVLHDEYEVRLDRQTYYLKSVLVVETTISESIKTLITEDTITYDTPLDTNNLRASATFLHDSLSSSQKMAIQGALDHRLCIITGGAGTGKCLSPDTLIRLANGTVMAVNKLRTGMMLQGPDGEGRQILSMTEGVDKMYRIEVSENIYFDCNEPHILTLKYTNNIIDVPLDRYLARQRKYKNYRLWQIIPLGVYKKPVICAYAVGYWFATVDSTRQVLHHFQGVENKKHFEYLQKLIQPLDLVNNGSTWIIKPPDSDVIISDSVRALLESPSYLTELYLNNSLEVRRELLAGIIDARGLSEGNKVMISVYVNNVQEARIKKEVLEKLIFSCGYRYEKNYIYANWTQIPSKYFDSSLHPNYISGLHKFTVIPMARGKYVGFELTGDGRFLLANGIVTHNTTCIREIVHNLQLRSINYVVCSFTGKAVSRIQEVLNKSKASNVATIHRLIIESSQRPQYKHIIIDETSMVTEQLLYKLWQAYPEIEQITMLGDVNQLPPISWGNLFGQLLRSNCIPTYRLSTNYRVYNVQNQQYDGIILNANRLLANKYTHFQYTITDNFNIYEGNLGRVQDIVRACYAGGISLVNMVILTPYNRYLQELNRMCQDIYNMGKPQVSDSRGKVWRVGDRVMLVKNNKDISVFNGEAGIIDEVDEMSIDVNFGTAGCHKFLLQVPMEQGDDDEESTERNVLMLQQAYAITVDKSQGSEWDFVIFFIPEINTGNFLNKNRIYTAVTRAKRACWCIVPDTVLFSMVSCKKLGYRCDNLASRLNEVLPPIQVWEDAHEQLECSNLCMNNDDMTAEEMEYFADMF